MSESQDTKISRRSFMKVVISSIGGAISAAIGLPAVVYLIGPALQQTKADWINLGSVNKVELDTPTLFKTTIEIKTGWINAQQEISAFVLTENGQDFTVMSNVCTHLGCRIRWIPDQGKFYCPCHNAVFSKDGNVLAGPPPRPLDRFENKVEDGIIYIKRG